MAQLKQLKYDLTSGYYGAQKGIYTATIYSDFTLAYVHLKTNISTATSEAIWMMEAVGYSYAGAAPIRCAWNFYAYNALNNVIQIGTENVYTGLTAHGVYKSSDNFVVLRGYKASNFYYDGFVLNAYWTFGYGKNDVGISAMAVNNTSGAHY